MFAAPILDLSALVLDEARIKGLRIATAESCTGGLISGALTAIAGSSDVFERGFVVYSNQAKTDLLDVPPEIIAARGAVSPQVARAMAAGARQHSAANVAVSCTGIAGPGGGTPDKPVGLVHLAVAAPNTRIRHREYRFGDLTRDDIRMLTVEAALQMLLDAIRSSP